MANANLVQTNFTAGEISPKLLGRYDVERYKNAVAEMTGFIPQIQGGIKSTPTRRYLGDAKNASQACRLIRFVFSQNEANMLEFGHQYMRVWNQDRTQVMDGGSPYEIATVFDESELFNIEYVGNADTIFLFHQDHHPQRLRRFDNDNWVIDDAPFDPQPFIEQGHKPAQTLTLSAATVGTGRTFTAGGSAFLEGDVGRYISYLGGVALITGYTSATVVTCTIETAFDSTSIASGVWSLEGTPQVVCNPSADGELGETITLDLTTTELYESAITLTNATVSSPTTTFTTAVAHGYSSGNVVIVSGMVPIEYNGTYEITAILGNTFDVTYDPSPGGATTYGTVKKVASGAGSVNGWRSEDVGSFVSINGGLIEITVFNSATSVDGIVRQKMTSDIASQAGAWILNQPIFNSSNGYPRCGALYQQSLILAGTPEFPHTIIKSRTGEYLNFELGVNDDDAFMYTLDADEYNPILHLAKVKNQLLVLSSGAEHTVGGGVESPLTPTNTQVSNPSDYGCNEVRPVKVEGDLIFVTKTGKKVRALGYELQEDSYTSPDISKLSEHITGDGLVDMTYQQEPDSLLWAVRVDGTIVTACIDRQEGILSWCRQVPPTGQTYESIESIPNGQNADEVWCVVNTDSNRYIEAFDASTAYGLASAVSGSSGSPTTTITGLDHLDGETVEIVGDGVIVPSQTVASGQVTVPDAISEWVVGLPSHGYIKTLSPEFITQGGSAQGNNIRIGRITVQVLQTYAILIDGQFQDGRQFGDSLLDQPPPETTGLFNVGNLGWQKQGYIEIEQANALPCHILALILQTTVNTR